MGCGASQIHCPKCGVANFPDTAQLMTHLKRSHQFGSFIAPAPASAPPVPKCKFCGVMVPVEHLVDHLQQYHISPQPPTSQLITCPNCGRNDLPNWQVLLEHLQIYHGFTDQAKREVVHADKPKEFKLCQNCGVKLHEDELIEHLQKMHIESVRNVFSCPKCSKNDIKDGEEFIEHLQRAHGFGMATNISHVTSMESRPVHGKKKLPQVGDKVLAMWCKSQWQYFHATIVRYIPDKLRYEIDWDDGDTTGRLVDYHNIAVDKIPGEMEIGIGSIILFPQGSYTAGETQLTGGQRWHQGRITSIYTENKVKYYDGVHTKGPDEGKHCRYRGYQFQFTGFTRESFRVGPNVFNILDDDVIDVGGGRYGGEGVAMDDIDIYFSCAGGGGGGGGDSFEPLYNPSELSNKLKAKGLKVVKGDESEGRNNLIEKVNMMRNSKVFIACISDDYVLNEQCRMEFQYAKSTLRKPVVPVVIGNGTEWPMSVVGMLIAGELYIHFRDKSVEEQKLEEVLRSLSTHITKLSDSVNKEEVNTNVKLGPGDVFISYCWSNSWDAKENSQISNLMGTKYSDPRNISRKISDLGYKTWLDIERLKSADQNAGLYEQLTEALKQAKLVVPCISDEYAASANCQMEFKFAINSLRKPVLPLLVGNGEKWKETVVGALLASNELEPINFQSTDNEQSFDNKFELLTEKIKERLTLENNDESAETVQVAPASKSRAPKVGDHVVSHHFNWNYYMATVVSFNRSTMHYTVAWDDGDKSGTVQPFNQVAVDVQPKADEIGVGSIIFFPQGTYVATEGSNEGGVRYHEGVITKIKREGELLICGHHTRGPDDRKRCNYRAYSYEFYDIPISSLRLAPTALESFGI